MGTRTQARMNRALSAKLCAGGRRREERWLLTPLSPFPSLCLLVCQLCRKPGCPWLPGPRLQHHRGPGLPSLLAPCG